MFGSNCAAFEFRKSKMASDGHVSYWLYKNGHNFAAGVPIYVMFYNINTSGSRLSAVECRMVVSVSLDFLRYEPSYRHCCRALTFASAIGFLATTLAVAPVSLSHANQPA